MTTRRTNELPKKDFAPFCMLVMPKQQTVKKYTYVTPEKEATQNSNVDCRQIQASRSGLYITEEQA